MSVNSTGWRDNLYICRHLSFLTNIVSHIWSFLENFEVSWGSNSPLRRCPRTQACAAPRPLLYSAQLHWALAAASAQDAPTLPPSNRDGLGFFLPLHRSLETLMRHAGLWVRAAEARQTQSCPKPQQYRKVKPSPSPPCSPAIPTSFGKQRILQMRFLLGAEKVS